MAPVLVFNVIPATLAGEMILKLTGPILVAEPSKLSFEKIFPKKHQL
jgi:hypothetical protein